jgi:hypothetical protein
MLRVNDRPFKGVVKSVRSRACTDATPVQEDEGGIRLLGVGRYRSISLASLTCDCFVYMIVWSQNKERANGTRNTGTSASV